MIQEITVENLAIIERAQLPLGPGFTVLTGETGAGKSLLVDAIELALGERADTELVRAGARSATVHLALDLTGRNDLLAQLRDFGISVEERSLYIDREVLAEGRSQCRINGKLAPVSLLRQVGRLLVDLHGQHDHQSLLNPERHLAYLDAWIGEPATQKLTEIAAIAAEVSAVKSRLDSLRRGLRDREQRLDLLKFQIGEIEAVDPKVGEVEELETQLSRLKNIEKLSEAAAQSLEFATDGDQCASDLTSQSLKPIEDVLRLDDTLESIATGLREALLQIQEAGHSLRAYVEDLEADPTRLEEIAGRIDALKRLRRKYGDTEAEVLEYLHQSLLELEALEASDLSQEELEAAYNQNRARLITSSGELTSLRKEKGIEFAKIVQSELREMAMDRAIFEVSFLPKEPASDGADLVEFYFSANAGEPPRPLSKIASGGEISRVMLAIKSGLAGKAGVPTLIFDEVDAGLGGRAAADVAKKLRALSRQYQVVVISHLAQIASRADVHFHIEKNESSGRVVTSIRRLQHEERIEELARMISGHGLTDAALANAKEMLAS